MWKKRNIMIIYMFKSIGNNGPLFGNLNQGYVNPSNSHDPANFSSNQIPTGPHTLPEPASNIQAAAAYIPASQKGGKINKKRINKISRKYKMSRTRKNHLRSRIRSRFIGRRSRRTHKRRYNHSKRRHHYSMRSGIRRQRGGWAQYQNNMPVSNSYALGGPLNPSAVGLANPPPIASVTNNAVDNLNHNALNSYGNSGAGMGTASKGWY